MVATATMYSSWIQHLQVAGCIIPSNPVTYAKKHQHTMKYSAAQCNQIECASVVPGAQQGCALVQSASLAMGTDFTLGITEEQRESVETTTAEATSCFSVSSFHPPPNMQ